MSHNPASSPNALKDTSPLLTSCQKSTSPGPRVAGTSQDRSELRSAGAGVAWQEPQIARAALLPRHLRVFKVKQPIWELTGISSL